jgi:hypothetical protein
MLEERTLEMVNANPTLAAQRAHDMLNASATLSEQLEFKGEGWDAKGVAK